jgi:hypothetical protein
MRKRSARAPTVDTVHVEPTLDQEPPWAAHALGQVCWEQLLEAAAGVA